MQRKQKVKDLNLLFFWAVCSLKAVCYDYLKKGDGIFQQPYKGVGLMWLHFWNLAHPSCQVPIWGVFRQSRYFFLSAATKARSKDKEWKTGSDLRPTFLSEQDGITYTCHIRTRENGTDGGLVVDSTFSHFYRLALARVLLNTASRRAMRRWPGWPPVHF